MAGHVYSALLGPANQQDAILKCEEQGSELVYLENLHERDHLSSIISVQTPIWMHARAVERRFRWNSPSTQSQKWGLTYKDMPPRCYGKSCNGSDCCTWPNSALEVDDSKQCLLLSTAGFVPAECAKMHTFVCRRPGTGQSRTPTPRLQIVQKHYGLKPEIF